jgi:hypothetical protein
MSFINMDNRNKKLDNPIETIIRFITEKYKPIGDIDLSSFNYKNGIKVYYKAHEYSILIKKEETRPIKIRHLVKCGACSKEFRGTAVSAYCRDCSYVKKQLASQGLTNKMFNKTGIGIDKLNEIVKLKSLNRKIKQYGKSISNINDNSNGTAQKNVEYAGKNGGGQR